MVCPVRGAGSELALVRALIWLVLFTFAPVLKNHDQDFYQMAAVESQNKQAYINMIKPGSVVLRSHPVHELHSEGLSVTI